VDSQLRGYSKNFLRYGIDSLCGTIHGLTQGYVESKEDRFGLGLPAGERQAVPSRRFPGFSVPETGQT
jgi:hypothetical protein